MFHSLVAVMAPCSFQRCVTHSGIHAQVQVLHNYTKQGLYKNILFCFLYTHWGGSAESLTTFSSTKKTSRLLADSSFSPRASQQLGCLAPKCKQTITLLFTFQSGALLLFFTVHSLCNPSSHVHSAVSLNMCFSERFQIRDIDQHHCGQTLSVTDSTVVNILNCGQHRNYLMRIHSIPQIVRN